MSLHEMTVEGTLQPDGTLQLDQKLNLSPGRVQVTVQPLPTPTANQRGLVEVMDQVREASQQARGYQRRSAEDMQAEENASQEDDEEYERRCQELWGGPLAP